MMFNLNGFNANAVKDVPAFEPVPPGKYLATITTTESCTTKAGTGTYLLLTFEVLEGPYARRRLWARLNLDNPNKAAVAFAMADLAQVCRAVGVLQPHDSSELCNRPLVVRVDLRRRSDNGEMVNEIRGYEPAPAAPAAPTAQPPPIPYPVPPEQRRYFTPTNMRPPLSPASPYAPDPRIPRPAGATPASTDNGTDAKDSMSL